MRRIILLFIALALLSGCTKDKSYSERVLIDLDFTITNTPVNQVQSQGIISYVQYYLASSCPEFLTYDIKETATRQYEIRVKGTIPKARNGQLYCDNISKLINDSITIHAPSKGEYKLLFYNSSNILFKTDTVIVG